MFTTRLQENIGRILQDRYTLVAAIGQGASGDVYLAQDLSLGRKVAIKLLHSSLAGDTFFLKRFQSEAKSAASLNHPHIMRVFDWGESGSTPYLVLEYLSGGSLREYLNSGETVTESQAASLMLQVAQGLSYAHGRGYVHRDIKPANLLFDDEARIRIADFGLARALSEAAWTEPVGTLVGTARYASPEQALARESDRSSDVYSLGLVIHEALLGYLPFNGDTTVSLLMARIHADVEIPAEAGDLGGILGACLRLSASERMRSTELVSELEQLVRKLEPPAPLRVSGPAPLVTDENGDLTEIGEGAALAAFESASPPRASEPVLAVPVSVMDREESGQARTEAIVLNPPSPPRARGRRKSLPRRKKTLGLAAAFLAVVALAASLAVSGIPSQIFADVFSTRVPLVIGDSVPTATAAVKSAHLRVGRVSYAYSPNVKKGMISSESPKNGVSLPRGKPVNLVVSKGPAPVDIPALLGDSRSTAESKLRAIGLVPVIVTSYSETAPMDQVIAMSPTSGPVDVGTKVTLTVSKGPAPRQVPNLVGEASAAAVKQLQALVLTPSQTQEYSNTVPAGVVISQTQTAGSMVPRGSTINFVVSKGPQIVTVPNVIGMSLQQAEATLNQAGLTVGSVYSYFGSNTVVATSPNAGSKVRAGTSVSIVTG